MLHEMASQALSIPEILSVVSSNGMEMEEEKPPVQLLRRDPSVVKWQAEIFTCCKMGKVFLTVVCVFLNGSDDMVILSH